MLTIASLTVAEIVRRRIALLAAIATIVLAGATAWGLAQLAARIPNHVLALTAASVIVTLLAFMFSFVLALGGAFLAAPAIATEVESGIVLAILPRPLTRAEYVLGKWLGLAAALVVFALVAGAIELIAIDMAIGYVPPHPWEALGYLAMQCVALASLALFLGTRLPAIAAGLIAVVAFGIAWIGGIAAGIAGNVHDATLLHATTALALLVPTDVLWRGAMFELQPVAIALASHAVTQNGVGNPFGPSGPPVTALVWWSGLWIVAVVGGAVASFARRDL